MAMLAEPRVRKRYILQPKGKALYEDDNRFGTKMLQKMGWTKGKGLGANENGEKDFVRVRFRNSNDGLGFEERDDQWTQHEAGFNELLKNLNGSQDNNDECANDASSDDEISMKTTGFGFQSDDKKRGEIKALKEKLSGQSLEEKSKQSRARVHYHKFTKGKDLSRYSEKDLANILGKKHDPHNTPDAKQNCDLDENKKISASDNAVHFKSSSMDLNEYFKSKMQAAKLKRPTISPPVCIESSITYPENNIISDDHIDGLVISKKKEKKSKRKVKEYEDNLVATDTVSSKKELNEEELLLKKKEKRKRKLEKAHLESLGSLADDGDVKDENDKDDLSRNKAKKKRNSEEQSQVQELHDAHAYKIVESLGSSRNESTKPSKEDIKNEKLLETPCQSELNAEITLKKKKKKKRKTLEGTGETMFPQECKKGVVIESQVEVTTEAALNAKKRTEKGGILNCSTTLNDSTDLTISESQSQREYPEAPSGFSIAEQEGEDDVYTISSIGAEKFRAINLDCFVGSNLGAIEGYSLTAQTRIQVVTNERDENNILRLYAGKLNKYVEQPKREIFKDYIKKVSEAIQSKQKAPRINVRALKRKNAFQGI